MEFKMENAPRIVVGCILLMFAVTNPILAVESISEYLQYR